MARNAFAKGHQRNPITNRLMETLFGMDSSKYDIVTDYIVHLANFQSDDHFVVVCDDLMVHWVADTIPGRNPQGTWLNVAHNWRIEIDNYVPCDPARESSAPSASLKNAYTVDRRYIYICPSTLDNPRGRSISHYKNQNIIGDWIDHYMLLPGVLFHELLHVFIPAEYGKFSSRSRQFHRYLFNTRFMRQSTIKKCKISLRPMFMTLLV